MLAVPTAALVVCAAMVTPPDPPAEPMAPRAHRADMPVDAPGRAIAAGKGLVFGGGATMAVGAGVLLPIAMRILLQTPAPDPANYTSVDAFERDVARYRDILDRGTDIGVAGAVVGAVGALAFTSGAIAWGVGNAQRKRRGRAGNTTRRMSFGLFASRRRLALNAQLSF
ncbi:MAG: hypothetical protein AAF721_14495 [Myxococcota bacterium]